MNELITFGGLSIFLCAEGHGVKLRQAIREYKPARQDKGHIECYHNFMPSLSSFSLFSSFVFNVDEKN